jgi:hypothetical protein
MGTAMVQQAEAAAPVAVEHELFTEDLDGPDGILPKLSFGADGMPIAAHEIAARGAGPNSGQ